MGPVPDGLFRLARDPGFARCVDVDVQSHRTAADRAILDVVLVHSGRDIHRDDDFLATRVADVRGLRFEAGRGRVSGWIRHWIRRWIHVLGVVAVFS